MNLKRFLLIISCLFCHVASRAQAPIADARQQKLLQRFPQADRNQDGRLTVEEINAYRKSKRSPKKIKPAPRSPMTRYPIEQLARVYQARDFRGLPYRLLIPTGYQQNPDKRFPLVLSLHGAGGKGDDNRKNLKPWNGVLMEEAFQRKHPCFVVAPQSRGPWRVPGSIPELTDDQIAGFPAAWKRFIEGRKGTRREDPSSVLHLVFELLDQLGQEFRIDPDRVYVLGHSMGGLGAFECVATEPDRFAAAIPSAGGLAPWHAVSDIADVPIWAFHGDDDQTVPIGISRYVFDELRTSGGNMKFTTLANVGHGASGFAFVYSGDDMAPGFKTEFSSDRCDRTSDVWDWLFAQKRD